MLGIGFSEILIIALVCFIAIGPKQLPMVMRKIAGFYRQFIALKDEFRFQLLSADDVLKEPLDNNTISKEAKDKDPVIAVEDKGHG